MTACCSSRYALPTTLLRCWWVHAVVAELDMRPDTWHRPPPIGDTDDAELLGPASR